MTKKSEESVIKGKKFEPEPGGFSLRTFFSQTPVAVNSRDILSSQRGNRFKLLTVAMFSLTNQYVMSDFSLYISVIFR